MIKVEKFVVSHRPYAVDLNSLRFEQPWSQGCWARVQAVWFRRKAGITSAHVGFLGTYLGTRITQPPTAVEFLESYKDGRYGGECTGRWDGRGYWGAEEPETIDKHLALLRPMLTHYPACPAGYSGWWEFEK
jgi:hypothetical protein